jgi:hypothetical protein
MTANIPLIEVCAHLGKSLKKKECIAMDELNQKTEKVKGSTGTLLEPQERLVCEQLAPGQPPHNQRAQSHLVIDESATQTVTA